MRTARNLSVLAAALVLTTAHVVAHEMTVMGTVAAIEQARIQVKTGKETTGQEPAWYPIDIKTKITRGKKTLTLEEARIKVDERIVIIVDHPDKGPMKTKEIRLAGQ
jgi:hypothetical protein